MSKVHMRQRLCSHKVQMIDNVLTFLIPKVQSGFIRKSPVTKSKAWEFALNRSILTLIH